MPRRPAATEVRHRALPLVPTVLGSVAAAAALLASPGVRADPPHVAAAILFLQANCGIPDARLEARRGDGRLHLTLRTPQVTRQTNLVHNDLRLFTEESMKKNAEMPPEIGACFEPLSNQVIDTLMALPANVASLPMAPPPAPTAAAPQGGYAPPVINTPVPPPAAAPVVVQATPAPAPAPVAVPAAGGDPVLASGGPVRVTATRLEVQPKSPGNWGGEVYGRMGVDITNTAPNDIRIALVREYPLILADGGLEFHFRNASGLHEDYHGHQGSCGGSRGSYTPLRPGQTVIANLTLQFMHGGRDNVSPTSGRVSGKLMVWDEVKQTCRVEPLATTALPIRFVR